MTTSQSHKPISVGLIGFGTSAKFFHMPIISAMPEQFRLSVVQSNREIKSELPKGVTVVTDIAGLIATKPELVIITAPTYLHFELAKQTISAGIHTVVEKPFVIRSSEGEELIALAKRKGTILSVYHNRRWDNGFLTIKKLLKDSVVGVPYLYTARFDRYRPLVNVEKWREQPSNGGGLLNDIGSHLIDQALSIFGKPTNISANIAWQRPGTIAEDYFDINLSFNKLQVKLIAGCFIRGRYPHLEIHGDKGSYIKFGLDPQESQARIGITYADLQWGSEDSSYSGTLSTVIDDRIVERSIPSERGDYGAYYNQLASAILGRGKVPVTALEALEVVKIIELSRTTL